jgi:hypothetical protein
VELAHQLALELGSRQKAALLLVHHSREVPALVRAIGRLRTKRFFRKTRK